MYHFFKNIKICYSFIDFFQKAMEKPDLSIYHLNLLHLQMDIVLFGFDIFKEKKEQIRSFCNTNSC